MVKSQGKKRKKIHKIWNFDHFSTNSDDLSIYFAILNNLGMIFLCFGTNNTNLEQKLASQ